MYRALLTYKRGELSEKVWRVAHGHHLKLKGLVLVVELFLVLKNMLRPAIGVQDEVRPGLEQTRAPYSTMGRLKQARRLVSRGACKF